MNDFTQQQMDEKQRSWLNNVLRPFATLSKIQ